MAAIASPRRSAAHRRLTAECPSTSDFFFFFSLFFGWKFHFISFHSSFFFVNDFSRTSDAAGTEKAVGRNGKKKETSGKPNNKKKCKRTRDSIFLFFLSFPLRVAADDWAGDGHLQLIVLRGARWRWRYFLHFFWRPRAHTVWLFRVEDRLHSVSVQYTPM